jgi:sugar fermentation stimulation protein A
MQIKDLIEGTFLERPNRFTVVFKSNNPEPMIESAHLRDPGRLKELLYPGARLLLRKATTNPKRKTKFDVIAVFKDNLWVLINSGFHSDLAQELIESKMVSEFEGYEVEKREFTLGKSRLDFLLRPLENSITQYLKMLVEVKGCTLVEDGLARFPDAPTVRGKKHVEELIHGLNQDYKSSILFLILKEDAGLFSPNYDTDPDFSRVLEESLKEGVNLIPFVFKTEFNHEILSITPLKKIKVEFNKI